VVVRLCVTIDDGQRRRAAIVRVDLAQESFEAAVGKIDCHGYPNRLSCGGLRSGAAATPGRLIKWSARRVATPRFFRVSRIMCWKRRVLMELSGPVFLFACRLPPDEQEASYLAASARMESLSITEVMGHLLLCVYTVYRSGSSGPVGLRGQVTAGQGSKLQICHDCRFAGGWHRWHTEAGPADQRENRDMSRIERMRAGMHSVEIGRA